MASVYVVVVRCWPWSYNHIIIDYFIVYYQNPSHGAEYDVYSQLNCYMESVDLR